MFPDDFNSFKANQSDKKKRSKYKMKFRWSGLRSRFRIGNAVFPDSYRDWEGLTEWKGEIVDGLQDFFREALPSGM